MNTLPASMEAHKPRLNVLFEWLVDPALRFVRKNCKELIPTSDINLPFALMNIFEAVTYTRPLSSATREVSVTHAAQRII